MTSVKIQGRPGNHPPRPSHSSNQLGSARKSRVIVALGGNLPSGVGSPEETVAAALDALSESDINILAVSPFYRTPAWPDPSDPPYVNAVSLMETALDPVSLLARLHDIERSFGRIRTSRNAPRTLDLDLIDHGGRVETGPPTLPHPRMTERAFVLIPLSDVAPEWIHPVTGEGITELIAHLPAGAAAGVVALGP
ncbi:MAG: 2-amino-4-hydroxy-6-hydroxymethyldihydropteridine diphosphokinase [Alphaproteobacteria bacterium]|nr:2-amino-4-hydroxy-6-hydroxymethyldihydropteridine diphosphokinase [Alphaproteobacteria bacterium]